MKRFAFTFARSVLACLAFGAIGCGEPPPELAAPDATAQSAALKTVDPGGGWTGPTDWCGCAATRLDCYDGCDLFGGSFLAIPCYKDCDWSFDACIAGCNRQIDPFGGKIP